MVHIEFVRGIYPYKYTAIITLDNKKKKVNFGHQDYDQYKDQTPLKLYKKFDHLDKNRRNNYRARHSKILDKNGKPAYKIKYSRAWFSWYYLW